VVPGQFSGARRWTRPAHSVSTVCRHAGPMAGGVRNHRLQLA
jgi:hypothetical protein